MNHLHTIDWLRLIRDQRWTDSDKCSLVAKYGSASEVYKHSHKHIGSVRRRGKKKVPCPTNSSDIEADLRWLEAEDHHLITLNSRHYPEHLKHIYNPPIALFAKGSLDDLNEPKVAIVGSRRPTPLGKKMADGLATDLSELGLLVVSGLAIGIDGIAHQAALSSGSPTIAVMGSGLDTIYPQRNYRLAASIAETGVLLSEYPLGTPPRKHNFPKRNRIVSGLSLGVVVIEAAERSGTLITARLACEQNRELMVIPGPAFSHQYKGSHKMIQSGASLVCDSDDVLRCLRLELAPVAGDKDIRHTKRGSMEEEKMTLLNLIDYESTGLDTIISESGLTSAKVSSMLLALELEGLIATGQDGGFFRLS